MNQLSDVGIMSKSVVLVVEDDELLRQLLTDVVSDTGAIVDAVATAEAGLKVFKHRKDLDLVLTDVNTPGCINGWDLAKAIYEKRPDLPVIISTGYGYQLNSQLPPSASLLPKPWALDELCSMVKTCLKRDS